MASAEELELTLCCGSTIRAWASFETELVLYLTALLQTDQFRCRTIWLGMTTYQARRALLRNLASAFLDESVAKKFEGFLERATRLVGKRNMIAHSISGIDPESRRPFFESDGQDKDLGIDFVGRQLFDWENLRNWPKDIITLRDDMRRFYVTFVDGVHKLPLSHRIAFAEKSAEQTP